jgi:hypothetical protein
MGRPKKQSREPFWRSFRYCRYVHHNRKQERLSLDQDVACTREKAARSSRIIDSH